jgi:hypothetical protein
MQMLSSLLASSLLGAFPRHDEELLLNVVAACTNITYYASQVRGILVYVFLCVGTVSRKYRVRESTSTRWRCDTVVRAPAVIVAILTRTPCVVWFST